MLSLKALSASTPTAASLPPQLRCPAHGTPLTAGESDALVCASGCRFPLVRDIPRFVDADSYANSFGLQWNLYRTTQLDSYTGVPLSRERLTRCLGGRLDIVRGKDVLEAGCGAGRFTEVLLEAGAHVFALDLSAAVEANRANCGRFEHYFVCQANILQMPVAPRSFDVVLCLGVIQHTPNPEQTIAALAEAVKPGGMLVIDHYHPSDFNNLSRRALRRLMLRMSPHGAYRLNRLLCRMLIPLHRWLRPPYRVRGLGRLRNLLNRCSPIIDHYQFSPQLPPETAETWMELDTHDYLTDYYKHARTCEQIRACLESCGLVDVKVWPGGNGVEAHGRRPE